MSDTLRPLKIKVCGVTQLSDLDALARAGVDTVGFNFVARSPRCLQTARAQELSARAQHLGLRRVAVVMDPTEPELRELLAEVEVDLVQFHGHEPLELAMACGRLGIIRATSWTGRVAERELVAAWIPLAKIGRLMAWLVDAYAPGQGGGTGKSARWDLLNPRPAEFGPVPLILAGGLNVENVAAAIAMARPDAVDTASGVELEPGLKSAELVAGFTRVARRELTALREGRA